ncbi:MAG: response regulator transcription factor [Verrucomicrobia bacterium]|nr:response regulator transcription factor [Verrucomicrobiota bacterium]
MKRVLVIEDDDLLREKLLTILRLEGFEAEGARDGATGLLQAQRLPFDLILCDVMMPALDGHAVLQHLRNEPGTAGTPFIFLTARGENHDVRKGMNLGADDYLVKPVEREDLLEAIRARLGRREQYQQVLGRFRPDFASPAPLEALGLTPREAEVLLWLAQGKTNSEIGVILNMSRLTAKTHVEHLFRKLNVETRNAATVRALEVLSVQPP